MWRWVFQGQEHKSLNFKSSFNRNDVKLLRLQQEHDNSTSVFVSLQASNSLLKCLKMLKSLKVLFISVILSDIMINFFSCMYLQDVISTLYFPELKYSILIFQTYEQDLTSAFH